MVGGLGGRIVARLAADGTVYTTNLAKSAISLKNYKIQTDGDIAKKRSISMSSAATVVDLGKQLLQYAKDNNVDGVRLSISKGAPFSHDWLGMTALHFAAMNNQYEMCEILLNGGINKDAKTKVDRTPLHLACFYGNDEIVELLLSRNCQVNAIDMLKMTALHWAVEKQYKSIVRLLLKFNADVTLVSKFGKSPIGLAVLTEQADILEELQNIRNAQLNRKIIEEREKETFQAVNSIMNHQENIDENDFYKNLNSSNDFNISDSLKDSSINLLQSHGISMLSSNAEDSKVLLSSALNNGRQLILSEGGKRLLNETKIIKNNIKQPISNNSNIIKFSNVLSKPVTMNSQSHLIPPTIASSKMNSLHYGKGHSNNINKGNAVPKKQNTSLRISETYFPRNRNIRVISLNDFKKYYGNIKNIQGYTKSVSGSHTVSSSPQILKGQKIMELEQSLKNSNGSECTETNMNDGELKKQENLYGRPMSSEIKFYPSKLSNMANNQNNAKKTILQTNSQVQDNRSTNIVCPNSEQCSTTITSNVRRMKTSEFISKSPTSTSLNHPVQHPVAQVRNNKITNPNVIPLLTTSQICRQILDLRKQNEDLKRKFELAQKQKDDLLVRVERLEEVLLLEKSDLLLS